MFLKTASGKEKGKRKRILQISTDFIVGGGGGGGLVCVCIKMKGKYVRQHSLNYTENKHTT